MLFKSKARWWLAGVIVVAFLIGAVWVFAPRQSETVTTVPENTSNDMSAGREGTSTNRVLIGGIERSASDAELMSRVSSAKPERPIKPHGFSPALAPNTNPQVEMVAEALNTRKNPERFSSFVIPKSFDSAAFASKGREYSTEYAAMVEPGRVFAPAKPGTGVTVIRPATSRFHRIKQGESVRLSVKTVANSPVTFTSFDLGQFENQLSSTTVVAAEDGKAEAVFTATGGTLNEVQILAASPVSTGQVAFTVSVQVGG